MKGWKTILFALISVILTFVEGYDFTDVIPDKWEALAVVLLPILFGYLRTITNTAVGKSK